MTDPARKKATADDLRSLYGEDSRYELIHGELVEKAMPSIRHSGAESYLTTALSRRFDRKAGGRWPGGWWIRAELHVEYSGEQLFCHDISGYRRDLHPDLPKAWPMRVRPDWVCEVLSPNHVKRDRIDKHGVLFRSRVPHYWIADAEEKTLEVLRWAPDGYVTVLVATSGDVIRAEPFDAVELRAAVLFGDEDDEE